MRLLADENIAPAVITALREDGHDVLSVREVFPGVRDWDVMKRAVAEQRIILTHDRDFGNVVRLPLLTHMGVILIRCRNRSPTFIAPLLRTMLRREDSGTFKGKVAVVRERNTRIYP